MGRLVRLGLFALLVVGVAGYLAVHLSVTTDMSKMMPASLQVRASLARAIATSRLSQTVVLSLRAASKEEAAAVSKIMEERLRQSPSVMRGVATIQGGPPEGVEQTLWELYHPRRLGFAAPDEAQARRLVSDDGLARAVHRLKEQLYSPLSALVTRTAPADPFLALPNLFGGLEKAAPQAISIEQGRYVAQERYAVLFLELSHSSFDADAQEETLGGIEQAFSKVRAQFNHVTLEWSALARFSVSAKRAIQADITRVSVISTTLVVLMCLLLFRSLRMLLLALLPIASGMLAGLFVLTIVYGEVHGLTLAFGASLIGVTIDAVVHYYMHYLYRDSGDTPWGVMRRVAPAMVLGGMTTVVGFIVLSGTALVGLAQAALFGAVGVLVAYAVTYLIVPLLLSENEQPSPVLESVAAVLGELYERLVKRAQVVGWAALGLALLLASAGLSATWDSDMKALLSFDPALEREEEVVRARVAQFDTSRFVVALGGSDEEALVRNERAVSMLEEAVHAEELSGFQSAATLLPSAQTQRATANVLRQAHLQERLPPLLESAGFSPGAFDPFWQLLAQPEMEPPLRYEDVAGTALASLIAPHRVELEGKVAWLTFLRDPHSPSALANRFANEEGVLFIDQSTLMDSVDHRPHRLALVFFGGLAVILLLMIAASRGPSWLCFRLS